MTTSRTPYLESSNVVFDEMMMNESEEQTNVMLTSQSVEAWLNKNPEWFKTYAFENLDIKTVEEWLRSNNQRICRCKRQSDAFLFTPDTMFSPSSPTSSPIMAPAANHNNNYHQTSPNLGIHRLGITNALNNSHLTQSASLGANLKIANDSYSPTDTEPMANGGAGLSSLLYKNGKMISSSNQHQHQMELVSNKLNGLSVVEPPSLANDAKNIANSLTSMMMNQLYRSHSYTCVIHSRYNSNGQPKKHSSNESSTMSSCTEELGDGLDESDDGAKTSNDDDKSPSNELAENAGAGATSNSNSSGNHQSSSSSGGGGGNTSHRKNSFVNAFDVLSSNFMNMNKGKQRSNVMNLRKYHTLYSSESTTSLNILKFLIESKIKFPPTNTSSATTADKMKLLRKEKKHEIEFLLELVKDISYELCLKELSDKILNNLKLLVNAEKTSLFFVSHGRQRLASFTCDPHFAQAHEAKMRQSNTSVNTTSDSGHDFELELPFGNSIMGEVAKTGKIINIPNLHNEKRFDPCIDPMVGFQAKSLLCVPIKNFDEEVIAVVQLVNKIKGSTSICAFDDNDMRLLNAYLPFCGTSIVQALLFDLYAFEYERNRALLECVHDLFEQQTNLDAIVFKIMQKAQTLLKCQRCSVLLILEPKDEVESVNSRKAFDLIQSGNKPGQRRHSVEDDDGTKISRRLADFVINTGNNINLQDAYKDPRFDPVVDTVWRFKTKALLCMPIRDRESRIIGCAQIANRLDNQPFDENDEQLFQAFCIFCGLGINNTLIYNQLEKSMAEKSVALEVLSYHATCPKVELSSFLKRIPHDENFAMVNHLITRKHLSSYVFDDLSLTGDEMILASYEMFKNSGLMKAFQIEKQTLFLWLLTVRKNYRDVEYHNWKHAFNVCQSMFAIFENSKLSGYLEDSEKLALIVGCLCHDLDHRGTNNMFQVESHSALSQLYGTTATMEKHHFNHCIMILNTPGHNIFSHLQPRTYALVISYLKEAILATDLANHFAIRRSFEEAVDNKDVRWYEEPYGSLLRNHLMTCCDLAAVTKPWPTHRQIVDYVTREFFAQGHRERFELNIEPQEMMDPLRSDELPRLQIGWIDNVCLPLYRSVAVLCDSFEGHLVRIDENRRNWSAINQNKAPHQSNCSNHSNGKSNLNMINLA